MQTFQRKPYPPSIFLTLFLWLNIRTWNLTNIPNLYPTCLLQKSNQQCFMENFRADKEDEDISKIIVQLDQKTNNNDQLHHVHNAECAIILLRIVGSLNTLGIFNNIPSRENISEWSRHVKLMGPLWSLMTHSMTLLITGKTWVTLSHANFYIASLRPP